VTCNEPPSARCLDGSTLRTYGRTGTCDSGTCSYGHDDQRCDHGCSGNACNPDPCEGVVCDNVPKSHCSGGAYRTYSNGVCSDGVCSYPHDDTTCRFGCGISGCLPPPNNYNPIGAFDSITNGRLWGWTCDQDDPQAQIQVHVYVGGPAGSGTGYATTTTHASESAVNNLCGGGSVHRFSFNIPNWSSRVGQPVYAYGINITTGGGNTLLGGSPRNVQ
jgi:hypothetical protein